MSRITAKEVKSGVYSTGDTLKLKVVLTDDVTSVVKGASTVAGGYPYLRLNVQSPSGLARAEYESYAADGVVFAYKVQPGDFVDQIAVTGLELNTGRIVTEEGDLANLTLPPASRNLAGVEIPVSTISFSDYSLAASALGKEGDTVSVEITRRAEATAKQGFNITVSENGKVSYPTAFAIPAGAASAFLDVNLIERTDSPLILTLRPTGYTSAAGDLVLTLDITAGEKPAIFITGSSQMTEGDVSTQLAVSLARAPKTATTVTLTSDDGEANLKFLGTKSLSWAAGEEGSKTVTVQPLDGGKNVTVTARDASGAYNDGVFSVYIENKNPILIAPAMIGNNKDEPWEDKACEGFAYTLTWSGTDVQADIDTLTVTIFWGDCTTTTRNGAIGFAQHLYTAAGTFNVTVTLRDKDGGFDSSVGKVTVYGNPKITTPTGTNFVNDCTLVNIGIGIGLPEAKIYYSTNGTPHIAPRYLYTEPFVIYDTTTIKAIATWGELESQYVTTTITKLNYSLNEAVDANELAFTTGGDAPWSPDYARKVGNLSARSGVLPCAEDWCYNESWLEVSVTGPGTLGFWWKVNCEWDASGDCEWDRLMYFIDGATEDADRIDGVTEWEWKTVAFTDAGTHTVRWVYYKDDYDEDSAFYMDCGWVDGVTWTPSETPAAMETQTTPVPVPYEWLDGYGLGGTEETYEAAAMATAANGMDSVWQCYVAGLDPTDKDAVFRALITFENGAPVVSWEPKLPPEEEAKRAYTVEGKAELGGTWSSSVEASHRFFHVKVEMK